MNEHERVPDRWPLLRGDTLSNHDWFPFYGHRFLGSAFVIEATMDGRHDVVGAAMILWAEAMRQDPAGTLPDNDMQLAAMARFRSVDDWLAVRDDVLRDWLAVEVYCERSDQSESRLGHPLLEEVAGEMFKRKRSRDGAREAARLAVRKSRIRKKMGELGIQEHIVSDDRAITMLAEFFEKSDLYVTPDNLRVAMVEVIGFTGEVVPFTGARGGA